MPNQTTAYKEFQSGYDVSLLFPVLFLVGVGIVMIYSASSALALKKFGSGYYFLMRQALFAVVGIVALVACRHISYKAWRILAYALLFISFVMLVAVKVSGFGVTVGGATRWLSFGGYSFQPSELARFAMIIFLAYSISKKQEAIKDFAVGFVPHVMVLGVFVLLVLWQPDFGSAVILSFLTWIMLFVGGVRILHLSSALVLVIPPLYFFVISAEYRLKRLISFMDPWQYRADEGYQVVHSLMAFGSGGIWGSGIGKGYQKLFYLPEPHTDFIFSVIGEELGLIGVMFILALYGLIVWRGLRIARQAPDTFSALVALGLTTGIGLQVCVNMAVTLGLLPTKGLTLPFLSYGGTSLLLNMASVGILMNISTVCIDCPQKSPKPVSSKKKPSKPKQSLVPRFGRV
jgi:cell division protein FtsW